MTIELVQTISIVCFVLAVVFFLIVFIMFFAFSITKIIGEISGVSAKKAIKSITEDGYKRDVKPDADFALLKSKMSAELKKSEKLKLNLTQTTELQTVHTNNSVDNKVAQEPKYNETMVLDKMDINFKVDVEIAYYASDEEIE